MIGLKGFACPLRSPPYMLERDTSIHDRFDDAQLH
jgi:hypothetical protein